MTTKTLKKTNKSPHIKNNDLSSNYSIIAMAVVLLLTCYLYFPIRNHQFINYDDDVLVYKNAYAQKIANEGFKGIFTKGILLHDPITMLTHGYTLKYFGEEPKAFLTINMILHVLNVLLIFIFFKLLTNKNLLSLILATIFAFQPIHVESVAWATERKDVLFAFFFFLGIISYLQYLKNKFNWFYFVTTLICLILSILSKFSAVIFPFILVLIDYWKDRKFTFKVIIEKIIFALPVFIMAIIAFTSPVVINNNDGVLADYSFIDRLIFTSYSFTFYTIKSIFPYNLYSFIPYPIKVGGMLPNFYYYSVISAVIIILLIVLIIYKLKKLRKELFFGISFFIISISLVLHVIPFGGNVIVADRYTYIASSGLMFAIFASIEELIKLNIIKRKWIGLILITTGIYNIYLFMYSQQRVKTWETSISLFSDVIDKDQTAALAYYNRGLALSYENKPELAILDYDKAIILKPKQVDIYNNRGLIKAEFGDFKGAIEDYNKAIEIKQDYINAIINRSAAYMSLQNYTEVIKDCNKVLELNPQLLAAFNNRGLAKDALKQHNEAIIDYSSLLKLDPNYADAYYNRGNSYYFLNNFNEAIENYNQCILINPKHDKAICNRGFAKNSLHKSKEACEDWKKSADLGNTNAINSFASFCK